jgi:sugar-specific transcriptional regulator TrmB
MIFSTMKHFGYSELESKVYLTLLEHGALTGYEISKKSGVARSKVYNVIEGLVQKGVILVNKSQPILYSGLPSDEFLDKLKHSTTNDLKALDSYLTKVKPKEEDNLLWKLDSMETVYEKAIYMLNHAQESVYIQIWSQELSSELIELLTEAEKRIEKFVCILFGPDTDNQLPFKRYYDHGFTEMKLQDMGSRWINLICDNKSVLFGAVGDSCDVIWTQNSSMLSLAKEYVKHDAYTLKIIGENESIMKKVYGDHFERVRNIYE